jgi:hypothetical protein
MKAGDIVRVHLQVEGMPAIEWEDETLARGRLVIMGEWYPLKKARIQVPSEMLSLIEAPILAGIRVEMWNGGPENHASARMGWYIERDPSGKHVVTTVKGSREGRAPWDHVRPVAQDIANEIMQK